MAENDPFYKAFLSFLHLYSRLHFSPRGILLQWVSTYIYYYEFIVKGDLFFTTNRL